MDFSSINIKAIWTEVDFDKMGWHDCPMYGIRFEDEILIDLDYILKWELEDKQKSFSFWISPATLVFYNVHNLHIEIDLDFINGIEIADINKEKINEIETKWIIEAQEGTISLIATGYMQYIRKEPILTSSQHLTKIQRSGYCFEKKGFKD